MAARELRPLRIQNAKCSRDAGERRERRWGCAGGQLRELLDARAVLRRRGLYRLCGPQRGDTSEVQASGEVGNFCEIIYEIGISGHRLSCLNGQNASESCLPPGPNV